MEAKDLRLAAHEILESALVSVDAGEAVRRVLKLEGDRLEILGETFDLSENSGVYVIAIGKAAAGMVTGLREIVGEKVDQGVISCLPSSLSFELEMALIRNGWQVFAGGHPLPNISSLTAAHAAMRLLKCADERGSLVIFLISGGGSAMIEWPINDGITLDDLAEANRQLISSGALISEINSVRRAFSAVKGGKLAALAPRTKQVTLIISDTNDGDEANVASGLTLPPPINATDPTEVIERYRLRSSLPESILRAVASKQSASPVSRENRPQRYFVLLDNNAAVRAAADAGRRLGFQVEIAKDISEQDVTTGCQLMLSRLNKLTDDLPGSVCLISGGEFSCPVRGDGLGGRNSETVLRCAIEIDKNNDQRRHTVVLSAGTDGVDGRSSAAGAIADEVTIERARSLGLDARNFLERSDSFRFFSILDDTITTGPTGTNVRDLRILLAGH